MKHIKLFESFLYEKKEEKKTSFKDNLKKAMSIYKFKPLNNKEFKLDSPKTLSIENKDGSTVIFNMNSNGTVSMIDAISVQTGKEKEFYADWEPQKSKLNNLIGKKQLGGVFDPNKPEHLMLAIKWFAGY